MLQYLKTTIRIAAVYSLIIVGLTLYSPIRAVSLGTTVTIETSVLVSRATFFLIESAIDFRNAFMDYGFDNEGVQ